MSSLQMVEVPILENVQIADKIYLLRLPLKEWEGWSKPGQFLNLYFDNLLHLFPRPFSIAGFDEEALLIVYKVVGKMTSYLASLQPGKEIKLIGPLGNFFQIDEKYPVLLAGGVGIAPLAFLHQKLVDSKKEHILIVGSRSEKDFPKLPIIQTDYICTEDGSYGKKGNVCEFFRELISTLPKPFSVLACGPEAMLKVLKNLAKEYNFSLQVSLEKVMACGLGLCQGCAAGVEAAEGSPTYKLVCKDGPVFKGEVVNFDD